jgi:hypothetical protein
MQTQANSRVPEQALEKWQIGTLIDLLQYSVKIADRLVSVDQENETKFGQLGTPIR